LKPVEDQIYRTALKVIDQHIDPGVTLELGLQKQLRDKIKEVCELGCDINTAVSQAVTYYGALIRGDSPSSTERLLGRERIRAGVAPAPVVAPPPRRPAPRPAPEPPPRPSSGGTVVVSPGARYLASYAGIDFSGVAVQSHPGGVVELRTEEGVPAYVPVAAIMSVLPALPEGGMSQAGSSEAARIMRRKAEEEVPF
jgi:pyruvate/2-oxoglutarate dehydrogenase complex dihydrolipoamide acyltransferase (E2) component